MYKCQDFRFCLKSPRVLQHTFSGRGRKARQVAKQKCVYSQNTPNDLTGQRSQEDPFAGVKSVVHMFIEKRN